MAAARNKGTRSGSNRSRQRGQRGPAGPSGTAKGQSPSTGDRKNPEAGHSSPAPKDGAGHNAERGGWRRISADLLLLALSALLFSLAFPSFISDSGWWPLAYISILPAIYVINRTPIGRSIWYGFLTGLVTYMLHNYWIGSFHVLATLIVPLIYAVYYMLLFPLLALARRRFPRNGYLVQTAIWIGYEYLRTLGFLGYAYGILGYSQYRLPALVRFSSITGIWGISVLVVLPSIFLATVLIRTDFSRIREDFSHTLASFGAQIGKFKVDVFTYVAVFAVVLLVGGIALRVDYSESRNWRVALVQQDVDPHRGGISAYRESLDRSIRQSEAALAADDGIEAVIWSETSFVPPIEYHSRYRENTETLALVNRLRDYMDEQDVPYIIGNSDARRERMPDGSVERVDYNATVLFEHGEIQDIYRKVNLVPFTEHFPYDNLLSPVRNLLLEFDTHFWGKGTEYTVFETDDGVRFSTPICFEDTFGYLSRRFVNEGADVIVNLTNDRWAEAVSAAMQHMAMAVFRSGENRRTMVRGTNGGMTAVVDPNGVITAMDEPMTESHLIADAPVYTDSTTVYTRFGDWFAFLALAGALGALIFGEVRARKYSGRE